MNNTTEDLFKLFLNGTTSIENFHTFLQQSIQQNVPPESLCTLVSPLFLHAIDCPTNPLQVYVDILVDIHSYLNQCATMDDNVIFQDVAGILSESLHLYQTKGNFETLFDKPLKTDEIMRAITLASAACLDVLRSFNGSESEPLCDTLWQLVPRSIGMFVPKLDEYNIIVITKLAAIAESLLRQYIITPTDDEVSFLLNSMVSATVKCIKFGEHVNIIASCVSSVCAATPDLSLPYTSDLSDIINSLAASLVLSNNHTLCKAMFNVSFLLARNNAVTPWLSDFNTIQYDDPEIELLKENIAFAQAIPEDQLDFTHIQEMADMYNNYETKASNIIRKLISMEGNAEECIMLLNKLEYLAVHSDANTVESMCRPHMKQITEYVTQLLLKDPAVATAIISRIGYEPSKFLKKYLHFALPYAVIYTQDQDALLGLCDVFDQSPIDLVRQGASHIAIAILLEEDSVIQHAGERRLVEICGEKDTLAYFVFDNRTSMIATVAMNLGHPTQGQSYYKVMETINRTVRDEKDKISDFLSEFLLAILENVFSYINQVRNHSLDIQYPYALQSLKMIIQLLEENINNHNRHLIKVFDGVLELPNMQSEALSLWKTYIEHLSKDAVQININTIIQGLCGILVVSPSSIRVQVATTLHDLLVHNNGLTAEDYADFPVLPHFEELAAVKRLVHARQKAKVENEVLNIILGFSKFDDGLVLSNLQKLQNILVNNPYDRCEVDKLYAHLFHLIRKYSTHEMISYYAALCLGLLGATDPSTVRMRAIDDTVFVMRNHNNDEENIDFVYDLIINHIFPSYNTTNDETSRHCMEYSIQTLLKIAGFCPVKSMRLHGESAVYRRWRKYPREVQEFLAPFLESAYQGAWPDVQEEYPIFTKVHTFKDWVHKWYRCMTNGARGTAARIFKACLPMVQSDMTDIALHLLPYLVVHTILSGIGDAALAVAKELRIVLDINARPADDPEKLGMNRYALQVAVAITGYCRKWLHQVGRDDLTLTSMVERVNNFLKQIPNRDMGVAAFNAGAYPQAMMHFDTYMKEHCHNEIQDAAMVNYLRHIYLETEQLEDYKALMSTYTMIASRDEQIAQHMNLGEWDYAETLYKSKINDSPLDLSAYTGYLECLSKSNRFSSLLYEVDNKLTGSIPWQPQINSYRIDAAWHLEDWPALQKAVNKPMERNVRALVGCALHQMKSNMPIQLTYTIDEARANITKQIAMATSDSYRKCYPQVFELQLLQELEMSQEVWGKADAVEQIHAIQPLWDETLGRIMPRSQYRLSLLELRKAAFFDIRDSALTREYEAELWLNLYRENRKLGNMVASLNALKHAEQLTGHELHREMAKWYWKKGSIDKAASLLKFKNKEGWDPHDALLMSDIILEKPNVFKDEQCRTVLRYTLEIEPEKLEKAYYNSTSYFVSRHSRSSRLSEGLVRLHAYVIRMSIQALENGSKYYYTTMSRLFNYYFDYEKMVKDAKKDPNSEISQKVLQRADSIYETMFKAVDSVRPFQVSRGGARFLIPYPNNTIWLLLGALDSDSPLVARRMKAIFDKARAQSPDKSITEIIQQATAVKNAFYEVLNTPFDAEIVDMNDRGRRNPFAHLQDLIIYLPNEATMVPTLPSFIRKNDNSVNPFPNPLPTIKFFDSKVTVMKSLQKPKRIKITGSDGEVYSFLLKKEDDLRNDARTMEFFYMINHFLRKNPQSRDSDLYIRTFAIVPLGKKWGLIEWIDNLASLKSIVNGYWEASGNLSVNQITQKMSVQKISLPDEKAVYFKNHILPISPPVFYKWFLKHFPEPTQWLASRTRYVKTLAVMSIVGYIVGLGDRHADNIMFDVTSGDAVHVDLNLVFGKGSDLPVPELVPFRLTHNLVHAMGVFQTKGLFTDTCETTMAVMLRNKDSLYSVFQTLLNELDASEATSHKLSLRNTQKGTAKIMASLTTKFKTDQNAANATVKQLIQEASSNFNLAQMFAGWAPFV
ncbi:serine/threonine-protein kinase atr-like [Mucor ambiguus]|uniref:Serine/threonine-protein kinase ATR n=1 Tax=Mucor ambiguus TaxID=91626 RepID=A0A0C9M391_9FUNG|nr:serine/threonine-protein kinase atr-like [Mucor ambiguus]